MKTVWLTDKKIESGSVMLLGGFDGLHVGHRRLLSRAKTYALSVGVMTIVGGKDDGLFTFEERESIFRENGVDFVFELTFSEIKDMSPQGFLQLLQNKFAPKAFVCGEDFRFGAGASGTPKWIEEWGQVRVEILSLVEIAGEKVSSRNVKALLQSGKIEEANLRLGERFFLIGKVEKDRQVGRTLGFPTANIAYPKGKFALKKGVYETRVCVDDKEYKGITNYGARPTFENESVWTETYLDGFNGDLYGRELKVQFVRFMREITKFSGAESLKAQLTKDIQAVRKDD